MGKRYTPSYTEGASQRSLEAKIVLKEMYARRRELVRSAPASALKGLEGLVTAHDVLQQHKARGILIGSLAELVWSRYHPPWYLRQGGDVDVLLVDDRFVPRKPFEHGIDWWYPLSVGKRQKAEAKTRRYGQEDIVLGFGVEQQRELAPGLYILDREQVLRMRVYEVESDLPEMPANVREIVERVFREKVGRIMNKQLAGYIVKKFKGYILSEKYEEDEDKVGAIRIVPLKSTGDK